MKKWLIGLLALFLLAIGCIYFFIPYRLTISREVIINANEQGAFRLLADKNNWPKWWQNNSTDNGGEVEILSYGDYDFQINQILHNALQVDIAKSNIRTSSLLQIFSYSVDTINIKWSTEFITGNNPLKKIQQYLAAQKLEMYFGAILDDLKKYLGSIKNIYGVDIKKEKVQFQLLISTKQSFTFYPGPSEVYAMVDKLKNRIRNSDVKADTFPMLSVQKTDSANYVAQVALPVDKKIDERDNISVKWMMKGGNILTGEVAGGINSIDSSMKQFDKYILDYQRTAIAIPFQLLITDRLKQKDSTKWITRLYYPVI